MEKFIVQADFLKKLKRFKVHARTLEFKIRPVPADCKKPEEWIRDGFNQAILHATEGLQPTDMVGFTFCSKQFNRGDGWLPFKNAGDVTTDDVWKVLTGIFQSNSMGLATDTFCLGITSVRMPKGRGRGSAYSSFNEECARRKGIVVVNNKDNLCLPRALVVAIAHASKDPKYREVRQDVRREQETRAIALVSTAGVTIPEEGCGIPEVQRFQQHLSSNYKIVVYQYGNKGRDVIFEGPGASLKLNLLYHKGHYNVITSLTAAFCCGYYCDVCHIPYDHKNKHRCGGTCFACQQAPKCEFLEKITCSDCNRGFRSKDCFLKHKEPNSYEKNKTVCANLYQCSDCCKTVKLRKDKHVCGEIFCKICNGPKPADHLCYMQPDSKSPKQDFVFVFYDLETTQQRQLENGDLMHDPNLCVFKTACPECVNDNDKDICAKCGIRVRHSSDPKDNIFNQSPVKWFMTYLLKVFAKKHKQVVVLAHNGQAFDHQFLLNYMLTETDLKPELIMRGTKIVQMKILNIKFIDSLNFFPMALSALPKAFGLGEGFKKGYFPHLFNRTENQNYVGPLPASVFYSPDTMMDKDRETFLAWHAENKDSDFNFAQELLEYCISDVKILTAACLEFRRLLIHTGGVCPFTEACTIASACNKVYRRNFLKPNTIGIIPKGGYRWRDNQSKIAIQWLIWEEHQRQQKIKCAANGREAIVAGVKVHGFCEDTGHVYEFHGCYFHGCPRCFSHNRQKPLHDDPTSSMELRYEGTIAKTERLREMSYVVVEKWECEFLKEIRENPDIKLLTVNHPLLLNTFLNPRDAFYGGRTGNCVINYKVAPGEKIKYVDVCSLYPWVCKYGKFPVGHPEVFVGHDQCEKLNLRECSGLIKCTVLPPQNLYHPVLPLRMNSKLMFVLCRECGITMDQNVECYHTVEQRALHGTWVIEEVVEALSKGYKLIKTHEIWKYQITQYDPVKMVGGLFTEMMNLFIKYKQQASGWPGDCTTQDKKDAYIEKFLQQEGIKLELNEILSNPGLRSLAKLMLNSFWGKLGQRENQTKTSIVKEARELFELLSDSSVEMCGLLPINEDTVVVNWKHREEVYDSLSTVNVTLAAYTTTQARLKLYSYLERLSDRVLYYDTDSVIYRSREGEYDLPTGKFLGDLTDELEGYGPGSYITQFSSGGPKNYTYTVLSPSDQKEYQVIKVKGIGLNYDAGKQINPEKMTEMASTLSDEPVYITARHIRRGNDYTVVTRTENKIYRLNSTKRKFLKTGSSLPYGYKKQRL